jgi:predicted cupin superfamily sugar epimerase
MLSPATHTAEQVIALLDLAPLPQEGGWFRRTHDATTTDSAGRRAWSMILSLFTPEQFSALHRVGTDELWIFQAGDPLEMLRLSDGGRGENLVLGLDVAAGQRPQVVVSGDVWQGARLAPGGRWALVTCVVVPEFHWDGFQLGDRDGLLMRHPTWADAIRRLTRS